ncbi:MAG: hypothetical protein ACREID_09220 [Planctomycetota bacterium]
MTRDRKLLALVAAIGAAEAGAVVSAVEGDSALALLLALALHALACSLVIPAARRRRGAFSPVEHDAMLLTAACVPLFGPPLAWALPRPRAKEVEASVENAHAVFERYEQYVRPHVPDHERTLFTGDYDKDLARELDAESYHEVLRHGQTDQKRNALKRLADMGEPRHLELVRRCLVDPDHEVRLYAYSELERLARVHEEEIAKRDRAVASDPSDVAALRAMAEAHLRYGASGIQDDEMAAYHFRLAIRFAARAAEAGDRGPDAAIIESVSYCRLKEYGAAADALQRLAPELQGLPRVRIARAEIGYRQRDFETARGEAVELAAAGEKMPDWLEALRGAEAPL